MKGMELNLKILLRRYTSSLLTVLLTGATVAFLMLYPGVVKTAEEELDSAYSLIAVDGWMVNAADHDDPNIPFYIYDTLLASNLIGRHYDIAYTGYSTLPGAMEQAKAYDMRCVNMTGDSLEKYVKTNLPSISLGPRFMLYGINEIGAETALFHMSEGIEWFEGYNEDALTGNEMVCILPLSAGYQPGDTAEIILRKGKSAASTVQDSMRRLVTFKVIGVYNTGQNNMYCPLGALRSMLESMPEWEFCLRSFSFTLADSRKTSACKELLTELGLHNNEKLRAAIDDRILTGTTAPMKKNIAMLKTLQYVFYGFTILLGFFLCFLAARSRKREYAVMRLLGETNFSLTIKVVLEQILLCALGSGLAAAALLCTGKDVVFPCAAGIAMLCYGLGAAAAASAIVRADVMSILQKDE